jgi:predicted DNA-binding ribbon-helix-helix protein
VKLISEIFACVSFSPFSELLVLIEILRAICRLLRWKPFVSFFSWFWLDYFFTCLEKEKIRKNKSWRCVGNEVRRVRKEKLKFCSWKGFARWEKLNIAHLVGKFHDGDSELREMGSIMFELWLRGLKLKRLKNEKTMKSKVEKQEGDRLWAVKLQDKSVSYSTVWKHPRTNS